MAGMDDKVEGAPSQGGRVFLVPAKNNESITVDYDKEKLSVEPVETMEDVITKALCGKKTACRLLIFYSMRPLPLIFFSLWLVRWRPFQGGRQHR